MSFIFSQHIVVLLRTQGHKGISLAKRWNSIELEVFFFVPRDNSSNSFLLLIFEVMDASGSPPVFGKTVQEKKWEELWPLPKSESERRDLDERPV